MCAVALALCGFLLGTEHGLWPLGMGKSRLTSSSIHGVQSRKAWCLEVLTGCALSLRAR